MIQDNIHQWTENYMNVWMRAWEEASVAAVERVVALFTPDGIYHATPFSEGAGHEGIRVYESMIRTQQNGQGSVELLGVAGKHGVYRWFIEYDVLPKNLWASRLPQAMIDSPEWESYRSIDFSPTGNRIAQAGISTVEFNARGLVTHYRQSWHTKVLR